MIYSINGDNWPPSDDIMSLPYFDALDGDWRLVSSGDREQDGGRRKTGKLDGIPLLPDHMPTKVRQRDSRLKSFPMLDLHQFYGGLLASEKFKDIVESLEPRVHQFFPMHVTAGKSVDCGTYYYFNICKRLDTLHPTLAIPRKPNGFPIRRGDERTPIVFADEKVAGHHAWIEKLVNGFFISEELYLALNDGGVSGVHFYSAPSYPLAKGED